MEELVKESNIGIIKISDEVVSVIAGIAASEIEGVYEMPATVGNNLTHIFTGKKSQGKGVKVTIDENSAIIDINVVVEYGLNIPKVVSEVQDNVKKTVEAMTGLAVSNVNILVQNILLPKKEVEVKEK